jgi:hypothetical protein
VGCVWRQWQDEIVLIDVTVKIFCQFVHDDRARGKTIKSSACLIASFLYRKCDFSKLGAKSYFACYL